MGKILTISIAAFDSADTIKETLDSLIDSDVLDELEIIVVNDGSIDETGQIVEEYVAKYPQSISLVNKENGGWGSTVNESSKIATSKYFKLLDSDDNFETANLTEFVEYLKECETDIVLTDFDYVYPNKTETVKKAETTNKTEIKKAQQTDVPKIVARSSSKFSWPLRGTILSHYGAKTGGLYNDGINISAALNTSVFAAENGIVAYAGNEVRGMGNLVIIQHADGWMTVYAHLNSMTVRRGARVSVGQKIGAVGKTGKVTTPQLHFEIRKGTKAYNPINYLKK